MEKCENKWSIYPLIQCSLINSAVMAILGSVANSVILWCIWTCKKTNSTVKWQLIIIFSSQFLICSLCYPVLIIYNIQSYSCIPGIVPKEAATVLITITQYLLVVKLTGLTTLSIIRATALWSPTKFGVKISVSVAAGVAIFGYPLLVVLVIIGTGFHWGAVNA
ncbi:uncharacterized protein LOC134763294 isoform X2 [Penaeus indicus]|uniref:uncharacterized protein LOC134763294 isoform X2 n=1 Tax=Penaeus indicus TaxID=29960 RepID=UPI00300C95B3